MKSLVEWNSTEMLRDGSACSGLRRGQSRPQRLWGLSPVTSIAFYKLGLQWRHSALLLARRTESGLGAVPHRICVLQCSCACSAAYAMLSVDPGLCKWQHKYRNQIFAKIFTNPPPRKKKKRISINSDIYNRRYLLCDIWSYKQMLTKFPFAAHPAATDERMPTADPCLCIAECPPPLPATGC